MKYKHVAFNWCAILGMFGAHRFYLGKPVSAVLMLLTLGGLLIWWAIDFMLIAFDRMKDSNGTLLSYPEPVGFASFWERFAAHSWDGMIVGFFTFILSFPIILYSMPSIGDILAAGENGMVAPAGEGSILESIADYIYIIIGAVYYTLYTASRRMATPGKKCFHLVVVRNKSMARLSKGRSFGRFCAYGLSYMTILIGFLMVFFTKEKRALHDYVAGTIVLRGKVL